MKKIIIILLLLSIQIFGQQDTISLNYLLHSRNETKKERTINILENILEKEKTLRKRSKLPDFSLKLNAPNYSRSINEVMQPDGDNVFREVNNISSDISLSLSQKIPNLGSVITINNTFKRLDYLSDKTHSYSASWFNINISQPLNFFNVEKWDNKIFEASSKQKEFEIKKQRIEKEQDIIELFFYMLINQEYQISIQKKIDYIKELKKYKDKLIRKEYANEFDSIEININYLESISAKDEILSSKILLINKLNSLFVNNVLDERGYLKEPNINKYDIPELQYLKLSFEEYFSNYRDNLLIPKEKEIKEKKSRKFYSGNIALGYGYNNNDNNFQKLFDSPNSRSNLSLSLQIPIFDFGKEKLNSEILELEYSKISNDLIMKKSDYLYNIDVNYNNLNKISDKINSLIKLIELRELQLEKMKPLLIKGYILYFDYEKKELDLYESKIKKIELLKDYYMSILEIEKLTFLKIL